MLTVKQLREVLKKLPGDTPIVFGGGPDKYGVFSDARRAQVRNLYPARDEPGVYVMYKSHLTEAGKKKASKKRVLSIK